MGSPLPWSFLDAVVLQLLGLREVLNSVSVVNMRAEGLYVR